MMKWLAVCVIAFVALCPDAYANLGDEMADTIKICCNEGHQFARQHDCCDGPFPVSPESRLVFSFMCSMAQQECCKDYTRKKIECDKGIDTSISTNNCTSSKNTSQECCQECMKGTYLGASKDPAACQRQPKGSSVEEILSNDALFKCCEIAVLDSKETSSQRNSNDETLTLPSMCEEYAPNELCAHQCIPIPGTYRCECNPGFILMDDGRNCMEVTKNRCDDCQHNCNDDGVEVKCYCYQGYELMPDKKSCQDIDECQLETTICPPDAKCNNILGSFACILVNKNVDYNNRDHQCPPGYIWNNENNACEDIDECALGIYNCGADYFCYNMEGTYRCDQSAVIEIEQFFDLKDGNETLSNNSPKEITTTSTQKPKLSSPILNGEDSRNSSYVRTPEDTFNNNVRSGVAESNITEPSEKTAKKVIPSPPPIPHKRVSRLPQPGSTESLPHEIVTSARIPPKIPNVELPQNTESATTTLSMPAETDLISRLTTVRPSPQPLVDDCPAGFAANVHGTCSDINECETGEANCGPLQYCINISGGYSCSCPIGHKLIADHECEDVNECEIGYPMCSLNADCVNTVGSYRCRCHSGLKSALINDKVCVDIDECLVSRAGTLCQHRCNNVWGGYICSCHNGYRLNHDNSTCSDIDECDEFKSKIKCVGPCVNEPGSYRCTCPSGYRLSEDKTSCIDIDECETGEAPCANATSSSTSNLVCVNTRGSYECHRISCPVGYWLEKPHRCTKVDRKCQKNDSACAHQPVTISYNFITFVSNMYILDGELKLFTMKGPKGWPNTKLIFQLRLVNVSGPPSISKRKKANIHNFLLTNPNEFEALLSLVRPLEGPQSIELELSMELYTDNQYGGTAVAKIFIYVSEHEF